MNNKMDITFSAISQNESFARIVIAGFVSTIDPTTEEVNELKTIVSEAVTNAIIHGYEENGGLIRLEVEIKEDRTIKMVISDYGIGIENIEVAKEPFFTSRDEEERSGMGFTIMEVFSDEFYVESCAGKTAITSIKKLEDHS